MTKTEEHKRPDPDDTQTDIKKCTNEKHFYLLCIRRKSNSFDTEY